MTTTPTSDTPWSRREFVKTAAVVGAAGLVAPAAIGRTRAHHADNTLRVGVIGCGGRGTGATIQALNADPDSVLWSMGDLFPEKIAPCLGYAEQAMHDADEEHATSNAARKIQVPDERRFSGFDAFERVLASGVDVVILTTPPVFRPHHLAAAIDAGKHVFCEKPVAVDAPGVRSVLESAKRARDKRLSLMSGFCWRYQDQVCETFARLLAGGVGDLHTVQSTYNTTGWVTPKPRQPGWSDTEFQARNWQYFHPMSGDHVVEQAVHAIDWIAWAFGDVAPERCFAVGGRQTRPDTPETGNVFDHFSIVYEYPGGRRGYHTCRHWPNTPSDNSMFALGSSGRCTMEPWTGNHVIEGASPWKGAAKSNDMYQREHDVLFRAIRSGDPVNDGVRMSHTTLLAIMGRMAAYTGEVITWDQAMNSVEDLNTGAWAMGERATPSVAIPGKTRFT
ncbi:MAG: Gfo/Idh/MocA family oxidoreductase [Phycisphaerales bacterium]